MSKTGDAQPQAQQAVAAALQAKLNQGMTLHRQGNLAYAERCYGEILQQQPDHFAALQLLGVIARQTRRAEWGAELIKRAIGLNPMVAEAHNNLGNALRDLKRLAEALASYDQAIALNPNVVEAHSNRGNALMDLKRPGEALASYDRAIALKPDYTEALSNRGNALRNLNRPAEALASYDQAIALKPDYAEALSNRGNALMDLKRPAEALASYDQAIALKPDYTEALSNRGNALRDLKRSAEALASYDKAIMLKPDVAEAHSNRGNALMDLKCPAEALASYDQAIALKPVVAETHNNRGTALRDLQRHVEALASYDKAIKLKPDYANAHINRGTALMHLERHGEALASYDKAIELKPDYAEAYYNRGYVFCEYNLNEKALADFRKAFEIKGDFVAARAAGCCAELPILYDSEQEIILRRTTYEKKLRALCDWIEAKGTREDLAKILEAKRPFYLAYQGHNDRELQRLYGSMACRIMEYRYPKTPPMPLAKPDEKVKVAIVSAFFYSHSNWKIPIQGWLSQIDRNRFKIFGYHVGSVWDSETDIAAAMCDRFVYGVTTIDDWRREILNDAPHVIIYPGLLMDNISTQLAAQRLAPVQCNSWGHPDTSGMQTLDYYLSSDLMEPDHATEHYTERLIRLPNLSIYCEPLDIGTSAIARTELGLHSDAVVFWCGQSLCKYLPQFDQVFARIAQLVKNCQFVFVKHSGAEQITDLFRRRLGRAFALLGLKESDYCVILPRLSRSKFVGAIGQCDIFLDSIGWSGCNTTLESLCHNLPIVTMQGPLMRGRHSAAMLRRMGVTETITNNVDEFVTTAARLANHPEERNALRRKIASNKHRLYRDRACIEALEEFLERTARKSVATALQAKLNQGMTQHRQGNLADAERYYGEVLQQLPDHFDALHLLGVIARQTRRTEQGVELIKRAIGLNPNVAEAHNNLGNALRDLKRSAEALASYDRAIELKPDHAMTHYNRGNALMELKRPAEALASYDRAIALKPDYTDAHNNRGNALKNLNRLAEALTSYDQVIALKPDFAEAYNNRGNALRDLKLHEEALVSYDKAIALKPDYADAYNNRGNALRDLKLHEEALASYDKAIELRLDFVEAHINRGAALMDLKRLAEALASYDRAIALKPDYAAAYNNRGTALRNLQRHTETLASYDRAIALKPDYAEAHNNRGNALRDLKLHEEALANYDRAIALKPDYAEAHSNRGNALTDLRRPAEGLTSCDRAIALKLDFAEAHSNRGNALMDLKHPAEALANYDKAIALKPDYAEAYNNRGATLRHLKRPVEALASYDKAIALKPDYAEAYWNQSLCLLQMGHFEQGWRQYEWREKLKEPMGVRSYPQPVWLGEESIAGKTLFIYWEQGLGDTIQFCRYAKLVEARGAKVMLSVQQPLYALLKQISPTIQILKPNEEPTDFDYHCPLLSLPLALGTTLETIPAEQQYLKSDEELRSVWSARLPPKTKPRIGVVWSGNTDHKNDQYRSMELQQFLTIFSPDAEWICLQKEIRETDYAMLRQFGRIVFFGDDLRDFSDTSALLDLMDLVITIDTGVAHLAGALGKPVWILLPYSSDWRWLSDRNDSPWYPSARLFRQQEIGNWTTVTDQVKNELRPAVL